MKIRSGFVSNSSSSSFVIAYKEDKTPCPACGRCDVGVSAFKDALERSSDGHWSDNTMEALIKSWDLGDKEKKQMSELKEKGYSFANVSVSYHDESMNHMLNNSKNIIKIYGSD